MMLASSRIMMALLILTCLSVFIRVSRGLFFAISTFHQVGRTLRVSREFCYGFTQMPHSQALPSDLVRDYLPVPVAFLL